EQVAVARLRSGEGVLRPFLLGDVAQRRHRTQQLAFDHQGGSGHGDDALVPGRAHDGRLIALLFALDRALLTLRHVLTLGDGDERLPLLMSRTRPPWLLSSDRDSSAPTR